MTAALVFYLLTFMAGLVYDGAMLAGEVEDPDTILAMSLVYLAFGIPSILFCCLLHYRCWRAIPEPFRAITPGSAVGFLFIPFFNFYWAFVTWPKLAESLTAWQRSLGRDRTVDVHGLSVTYGILYVLSVFFAFIPGLVSLFSIVDLVIFIILYHKITGTINGIMRNRFMGNPG